MQTISLPDKLPCYTAFNNKIMEQQVSEATTLKVETEKG